MARAYSKCGTCNDLLWFRDNDVVPQTVRCSCSETELNEDGATGNPVAPTAEEIAGMN